MLSEKYRTSKRSLKQNKTASRMMETAVQTTADAAKWIALMKQYVNPVELTAETSMIALEK